MWAWLILQIVRYCWYYLGESVFMAGPRSFLTYFGINRRLESWLWASYWWCRCAPTNTQYWLSLMNRKIKQQATAIKLQIFLDWKNITATSTTRRPVVYNNSHALLWNVRMLLLHTCTVVHFKNSICKNIHTKSIR